MAENSTEVNGNNFSGGNNFEILFGSNFENDIIRAGNAGSHLWGGISGNDEIFGGNGQDTFIYNFLDGNDTIHNAESQDIVSLRKISLAEISAAQITDDGVYMTFSDGGSLNISGKPETFTIEKNGSTDTYKADYQNKSWTKQD